MTTEMGTRQKFTCVPGNRYFTTVLTALWCACVLALAAADDGTFFLKASKSVPRIGRRGDFDNFFLKASKSVPRIGRRGSSALTEGRDIGSMPWFRTMDTVIKPSRRSDAEPMTWSNIDKVLELSPELWPAVMKDSDSLLKDDFDYSRQRREATNQEVPEIRLQPEV